MAATAAVADDQIRAVAAEIGVDAEIVCKEREKQWRELLTYFEGRMLPTNDEGEQPLPVLNIFQGVDQVTQRHMNVHGVNQLWQIDLVSTNSYIM